jgi:AcrR family transcriptional regulator
MRKLAAQLSVQAGALYWHFKHKQALLDAMADAVLAEAAGPASQGTWEEQLAELGSRLRRAFLARRDGARVVAGTFTAEPNTLRTGAMSVRSCDRPAFRPIVNQAITATVTADPAERFAYGASDFHRRHPRPVRRVDSAAH